MKPSTFLSISFAITFIWAGFLAAISFMEAPVKFTAPSLTVAVGLDVGRHVFAALNKVEWTFTLISAILLFVTNPSTRIKLCFGIIFLVLSTQTFWLLPALDARALVYISGSTPPASHLHFVYIAIEAFKLMSLLVLGCLQIMAFKKSLQAEFHTKHSSKELQTIEC